MYPQRAVVEQRRQAAEMPSLGAAIKLVRPGNHGSTLDDPVIGAIAETHSKSPAQVMLRWGLQHGRSVIPKSTNPARIPENIDVFDFELSAEEHWPRRLRRCSGHGSER